MDEPVRKHRVTLAGKVKRPRLIDTLALQVGGWADTPTSIKIFHDKKLD
jgi:hypothetical protein